MKDREAQQKWWEELSGWLESHPGKADCLFVHDRQQGRLERCFDRDAALRDVDADTVDGLYRAASEGRLGMLRPDDGKPQLLSTDLGDLLTSDGGMDARDKDWLERERKKRAEELQAQNLFIWAAASDRRDREQIEARAEMYEQMDDQMREQTEWFRQWQEQLAQITKEQLEDMSRELRDMDVAGADEAVCNEKIRGYLEGGRPGKPAGQSTPEGQKEERDPVSGEMWGNTLRCFCRAAASEVPLSVRHVKIAGLCSRFLQQIEEQGIAQEQLSLNRQDEAAVRGTIEMGTLVERGLLAQAKLTSGNSLSGREYRECLRDFLVMKGIEETLAPHVDAHQEAIKAGEGPVSALQILMGHKGFQADDLREKAGKTKSLALAERMAPQRVAQMIEQNAGELAALGQQVMVACCQMGTANQSEMQTAAPKAPQQGGPKI